MHDVNVNPYWDTTESMLLKYAKHASWSSPHFYASRSLIRTWMKTHHKARNLDHTMQILESVSEQFEVSFNLSQSQRFGNQ